eukprot:1105746-Prorocentrum_minimum.AAC.1
MAVASSAVLARSTSAASIGSVRVLVPSSAKRARNFHRNDSRVAAPCPAHLVININTSDWSIVRIYPCFLRLIGPYVRSQ